MKLIYKAIKGWPHDRTEANLHGFIIDKEYTFKSIELSPFMVLVSFEEIEGKFSAYLFNGDSLYNSYVKDLINESIYKDSLKSYLEIINEST